MKRFLAHRIKNSEIGASLTEMALLTSCVAVICIFSLTATGEAIKCEFTKSAAIVGTPGARETACGALAFRDGGTQTLTGETNDGSGTVSDPHRPGNIHGPAHNPTNGQNHSNHNQSSGPSIGGD